MQELVAKLSDYKLCDQVNFFSSGLYSAKAAILEYERMRLAGSRESRSAMKEYVSK